MANFKIFLILELFAFDVFGSEIRVHGYVVDGFPNRLPHEMASLKTRLEEINKIP